jgi:Zn-dependent peptidase ImmA (M78 family)
MDGGIVKIPKKINVLGKTYKIKIVENFQYAGLCDSEGIIYLNKSQNESELVYTLIHEIIHAWQFRVGLNQAISRETLEVISEGISIVLCELFDIKFKLPQAKKK